MTATVAVTGGCAGKVRPQQLAADYETFLQLPGIELITIAPSILREAARLRAASASC